MDTLAGRERRPDRLELAEGRPRRGFGNHGGLGLGECGAGRGDQRVSLAEFVAFLESGWAGALGSIGRFDGDGLGVAESGPKFGHLGGVLGGCLGGDFLGQFGIAADGGDERPEQRDCVGLHLELPDLNGYRNPRLRSAP
ncbi:MAG: hypothetical protein H0W72_09565 [Planctomycetes bacterium]|nr:hypothetical protein [Planctomycetota bacterium]